MTNTEKTITMSEQELLEYTESVIVMAIEKKTPVRTAQRQVLTKQLNALHDEVVRLNDYGYEHVHRYTEPQSRAIARAINQVPSESIIELRKQIRAAQRALRYLEAAHLHHTRKWEAAKAKKRAQLDRRMAKHDSHKCSKVC